MEYIDYMFLCPQGVTVYTDNRKLREGISAEVECATRLIEEFRSIQTDGRSAYCTFYWGLLY